MKIYDADMIKRFMDMHHESRNDTEDFAKRCARRYARRAIDGTPVRLSLDDLEPHFVKVFMTELRQYLWDRVAEIEAAGDSEWIPNYRERRVIQARVETLAKQCIGYVH